jgi:hypothetical protein
MDNNPLPKLLTQVYDSVEKGLATLFLSALLACTPFFINNAVAALHGNWVDEAFSEALSEKYGHWVIVKDVRFSKWSDVSFGSLDVRSKTGKTLIRSAQGSLKLKDFDPLRKTAIETELELHNVIFFHEYYKNSPAFKPWKRLLKKPFEVEKLLLRIVQSEEKTLVRILKSHSNKVILDGEMQVDASGHLHDALHVSFSPWMMFNALFPGSSAPYVS